MEGVSAAEYIQTALVVYVTRACQSWSFHFSVHMSVTKRRGFTAAGSVIILYDHGK